MKFDINIVKALLEAIEKSDSYPVPLTHTLDESEITILNPDISRREIAYHLEKMIEAGLVDGKNSDKRGVGEVILIIRALTVEGHAFLDNARSETVWKKFKHKMETFKSFSLDIAKDVLADIAKTAVTGTS